jgi:hypothetical protein
VVELAVRAITAAMGLRADGATAVRDGRFAAPVAVRNERSDRKGSATGGREKQIPCVVVPGNGKREKQR